MKIEDFDKNFVNTAFPKDQYTFYDAEQPPFSLEGLPFYREHHQFYRIPENLTSPAVNENVPVLARHTAGAALRFRTDSTQIVIRASLRDSCDMNHMPRTGSSGFDFYFQDDSGEFQHGGTLQPGSGQLYAESVTFAQLPEGKEREWIINFPLYGGVTHLEIGIKKNSSLSSPAPHRIRKPVLFYGSSITQGGCASRPGNVYTSMLCRALDVEQINLGFSGSAKGEPAMAECISKLEMSCFVLDYDHNAPTPEHLEKTHEAFCRIIRAAQPDLPILMLSRCNTFPHFWDNDSIRRRAIIRKTYDNAVRNGDKLVWYIDGSTLFGRTDRCACTVDGCHPNDLGFYRMYETVLPVLKEILSR